MDKSKRARIKQTSREEVEFVQKHVKRSRKLLGLLSQELHDGAQHMQESHAAIRDSVKLLRRPVRRT